MKRKGCCGGTSKVEVETSQVISDGSCGTPAADTAQSDNALQEVQTQETTDASKAAPQTPQSDKADTGGCGCGSQ